MATQENAEEKPQSESPQAIGVIGAVEKKYREIKEHAETYPYVWASYAVVYGGLVLWTTYRWRKVRRTEDRVRVLQERLHKLYVDDDRASASVNTSSAIPVRKVPPTRASVSTSSAIPVQKVPPPSADKTPK